MPNIYFKKNISEYFEIKVLKIIEPREKTMANPSSPRKVQFETPIITTPVLTVNRAPIPILKPQQGPHRFVPVPPVKMPPVKTPQSQTSTSSTPTPLVKLPPSKPTPTRVIPPPPPKVSRTSKESKKSKDEGTPTIKAGKTIPRPAIRQLSPRRASSSNQRSPPRASSSNQRSPRSPPRSRLRSPRRSTRYESDSEEEEEPETLPVTLGEWQVDWANRAYQILLTGLGYIDTSRMGSGKTYVLLWLAQQFQFSLLVICPAIMIDVWRDTAAEYGVPVIKIISYQSLRSTTGKQPKHGLLIRHEAKDETGKKHLYFEATPAYKELLSQGIMVVGDEIQNVKNNSDQHKAFTTLLQEIIAGGGRSRFAMLSGTPLDKEEHAMNLLRLIGYIRSRRLFTTRGEILYLEGIQELIEACQNINALETNRVLTEIPITKDNLKHLTYALYVRVIKYTISGAMPTPPIPFAFDVKNGFYRLDPESAANLSAALERLVTLVRFNPQTQEIETNARVVMQPRNLAAVNQILMAVEASKVPTWRRVALQVLTAHQGAKVIISVNFIGTIVRLTELLEAYHPLILTGSVPARNRRRIIRRFNTDSTHRVLLMTTQTGGVGINLHDTVGNAPRFMLLSPSYKLLDLVQATGRIYRVGTASDATIRIVYGLGFSIEVGILTSLVRKTDVLKGVLDDELVTELLLPGDYPTEEEQ